MESGKFDMGKVVNLRMARKARKRKDADSHASANRVKHSRTKTDCVRQQQEENRIGRQLDGAKLETD